MVADVKLHRAAKNTRAAVTASKALTTAKKAASWWLQQVDRWQQLIL